MNLSLIDPFVLLQDYPETPTKSLRSGHSVCVRFSRKGDLLASGRVDGTVVIFDVETNGVACKLKGHRRQIQSLSWSRDGRYLLTASTDWSCILWDLQDGSILRTLQVAAPIYMAELHPFSHLQFVISRFEKDPLLVDYTTEDPIKTQLSSIPKRATSDEDSEVTGKQAAQDAKMSTTISIFTASGKHILTGTNKGWLNVIEVATCKTVYSTKLCSGIVISLRLTASGRDLVINASDRIIRTVQLPNLASKDLDPDEIHIEVEHKFQDVVNKLSWNHVAFSSTGEYVTASTFNNHDIYIWERNHGSLVKILEGSKEEHGYVEWHPHKPMIVACGLESGKIRMWSIITPEKWSALAPDFAEVEENVEYIEHEDEFDIHPQEEIHKRQLNLENEDVDVLTVEPVKGEIMEDDDTFKLPVDLDIDDSGAEEELIKIGAGTMRRKSPGAARESGHQADIEISADDKMSIKQTSKIPSRHKKRGA